MPFKEKEFLEALYYFDILKMEEYYSLAGGLDAEWAERTVLTNANGLRQVQWLVNKNNSYLNKRDKDGNTPLLLAARRGDLQTMQWLVEEKKVSLSEKNYLDDTVLLLAARYGKLKIVQWLVEVKTVKIDEKNKQEWTALHFAASNNHEKLSKLEFVKYLVEHGADIHIRNKDNETALLLAARYNYDVETVKFLVEKGSNIEDKNQLGETLLLVSAKSGQLDIVKYLIDRGANILAQNKRGENLLDLAKSEIKRDMVNFLLQMVATYISSSRQTLPSIPSPAELQNLCIDNKQEKFVTEQLKKTEHDNTQKNDNQTKILFLLSDAQNSIELEEWQEASNIFDQILLLDKHHLQALIGKGKVFEAQSELEKAQKCYEKCIKHNSQSNDVAGLKIARKRLEKINQKINQQAEIKKAKEIAQQQEIAELKAQLAAKEEALKSAINVKPAPIKFYKPAPVPLGSVIANNLSPSTFKPKPNGKP